MDYVAKHASALAKLKVDGIAADFSQTIPGIYDPITDTTTPPTVIPTPGYGVEIPGTPVEYGAMELIGVNALTIMWVPTTYGDQPNLEAQIVWHGVLRTIYQVFPIAPIGPLIAAKIVIT
jgi:hypothetical protein